MTKDEVPEAAWSRMSSADADKDGALSKTELEALFKMGRPGGRPGPGELGFGGPRFGGPSFGGPGAGGPQSGRGGSRGRPFGGPISADRLFEQADKNKDGSLSKTELEEHFEALHRNSRPEADKPTEKATDKPDEKPAEKSTDKPVEKKADAPSA